MTHREPEEIGMELLSISNELDRLKKLKFQAESIEITKRQACCPDVCETIKELETRIDNEMTKISFTEKATIKRIKIFPKEFRESLLLKNKLRTNKAMAALELRHKELSELKRVLAENNICTCK